MEQIIQLKQASFGLPRSNKGPYKSSAGSDSKNANNLYSVRLNYWKVILLSLLVCLLVNLISFGLRSLMFNKGEVEGLMVTLATSIIVVVAIGARLIIKQKKSVGWSLIIGASLTLLLWFGIFFTLSSQGW